MDTVIVRLVDATISKMTVLYFRKASRIYLKLCDGILICDNYTVHSSACKDNKTFDFRYPTSFLSVLSVQILISLSLVINLIIMLLPIS